MMFLRFTCQSLCAFGFLLGTPITYGQTASATVTPEQIAASPAGDDVAESVTYASYRAAVSAAYEFKNAGQLEDSRLAFESALTMESTDRQKADVTRALVQIYPELGQWDAMYDATERIVDNPPYPAMASLTVRSMLGAVYRKKQQDAFFKRYEAKLNAAPKDRTTLTILAAASQTLKHDLPLRAKYLRRLIELDQESGKTSDSEMRAQLAFALRLTKKETESAQMYQAIADSDKTYRAYGLAEAAESWQRAGERDKAITAAIEASNSGPGVRATRSIYQWHRTLGEIFLKYLIKAPAKKHFTAALEHANIDAYRDQCREKLLLIDALKD